MHRPINNINYKGGNNSKMHVERSKTVLSKEMVHVRLRGIVCGALVQS